MYRALAMPRSRPFGLPSHTPARFACPIQPHDYLASVRAVRQAELHPKLKGISAFVKLRGGSSSFERSAAGFHQSSRVMESSVVPSCWQLAINVTGSLPAHKHFQRFQLEGGHQICCLVEGIEPNPVFEVNRCKAPALKIAHSYFSPQRMGYHLADAPDPDRDNACLAHQTTSPFSNGLA